MRNDFFSTAFSLFSRDFKCFIPLWGCYLRNLATLPIIKPLSIIFRNCINNSTFPDLWKKSNICPIHKKGDKQTINNYRPVSLLPICGKIFERLIFNSLFEYLEKYKLLSPHQSGFRANDSCVDQLLSIVHNIYTAFDEYPTLESCGVFLDVYGL